MNANATLTLEQKIFGFLATINAATGLKEVTLQQIGNPQDDGVIDFQFRINSNAFDFDSMVIKPSDDVRSLMDSASKEFFGAPLSTNNLHTAFWVVPA